MTETTWVSPKTANDLTLGLGWKRTAFVFRLMIGIALLAYVFCRYDAASIVQRLSQAQIRWLVIAGMLMYVAILLSSLKWKSILHGYGRKESLLRLWVFYIEAGFFNLFFPGFVAGDVSRVVRTSADRTSSLEALMAVFFERFSGLLVASLFVGCVALLGRYKGLGGVWQRAMVIAIPIAVAACVVLLSVCSASRIAQLLPKVFSQRAAKMAEKIQYAIAMVGSHPALLGQLMVLSLLFILLSGPTAYFVARSINCPIPLHVLMVYAPLIALLSNLPISIAGVGMRENLSVFFYSALGFLPEDVIALAVAQSSLLVVINLTGGVLLLRSAQSYAKMRKIYEPFRKPKCP